MFAEACMLEVRKRFPDITFIILVPTTSLLDQWYVSLQEDLHVAQQEIGCYSAQEKPSKAMRVNLMVINTARQVAPSLSHGLNTFLIVDECHRAGSPVNALALRGKHLATLGISATPERQYDIGYEEHIAPVLGGIIYRYDYEQAFQDGIICPFELKNVHVDLLSHEKKEYARITKRLADLIKELEHGQPVRQAVERLLQKRARSVANAAMRIPVAAKIAETNRGKRTIIFHESIRAANQIHDILSSRKHSVTLYHSKLSPVLRRDNLRLFRRGLFEVLVTCRALDEGTNVPETSLSIIASSTASTRQRIQRLGRVLRPAEGKKFATIYTLYATESERTRLKAEEERLREIVSTEWLNAHRDHFNAKTAN